MKGFTESLFTNEKVCLFLVTFSIVPELKHFAMHLFVCFLFSNYLIFKFLLCCLDY